MPKAIKITYRGETHTIRKWSEILKIPASTIKGRYMAGVPIDQPQRKKIILEYGGESHTIKEWSEITGLDPGTILKRIEAGWTPERALSPVPEKYTRKKAAHHRENSLCWGCKNAVPNHLRGIGCEWSIDYHPVPGWKAEMRERTSLKGSYFVFKCPKFEKG